MNDRYYIDKLTYKLNEKVLYDKKECEIVHIHPDGSGVNVRSNGILTFNIPFMFLYKL
jgi:hypothetical protein